MKKMNTPHAEYMCGTVARDISFMKGTLPMDHSSIYPARFRYVTDQPIIRLYEIPDYETLSGENLDMAFPWNVELAIFQDMFVWLQRTHEKSLQLARQRQWPIKKITFREEGDAIFINATDRGDEISNEFTDDTVISIRFSSQVPYWKGRE